MAAIYKSAGLLVLICSAYIRMYVLVHTLYVFCTSILHPVPMYRKCRESASEKIREGKEKMVLIYCTYCTLYLLVLFTSAPAVGAYVGRHHYSSSCNETTRVRYTCTSSLHLMYSTSHAKAGYLNTIWLRTQGIKDCSFWLVTI